MAKSVKQKFDFNPDFQELILQYTVTDKKGYKALELYEDSFFSLTPHAVIAYGLKKYYKKAKRVPEKPFLRETLRSLYQTNKTLIKLSLDDKKEIDDTINRIYSSTTTAGSEVMQKIVAFAQFVNFKAEIENIDVLDYESYTQAIDKLRSAINIGKSEDESYGTYLVDGMKDRAHKRDIYKLVNPTPFWQLNRTLNAGGLPPGSIILIAGEAKRFKTGFLVNVAKFYLRRKKKVLYVDIENSEQAITVRTEQSVIGVKQSDIASGDMDDRLLKLFRKYKRLGAEMVIKRFPAFTSTAEIQAFIDKTKMDKGIEFTDVIIDYPDLMSSLSKKQDDFARISDVYVDIKNMAEYNQFHSVWCPSHVKSTSAKKRGTKYDQHDLAKCIDKMRHADIALGLQESDEEMKANIIRIEVIEQRNGTYGKVLFWVDREKQQMREFTKTEVANYEEQYQIEYDNDAESKVTQRKPRERSRDI